MFRFSSQQFETDDIKRIDQVSSLTAQIKLLLDFNLEGLVSKN